MLYSSYIAAILTLSQNLMLPSAIAIQATLDDTLLCLGALDTMASNHVRFLMGNFGRGDDESDTESSGEGDYESEDEDGDGEQTSDLPAYFLGAFIHRDPHTSVTASVSGGCRSPKRNADDDKAAAPAPAPPAPDAVPQRPPSPSALSPTPWRDSREKQQIIIELKDESSGIHLMIGRYSDKDFKNVNFSQILHEYASNKHKLSNFRANLKRLLIQKLNQTGPFKIAGTEPWYTSAKNVSKAYSLLFQLYMAPSKSHAAVANISDEELWKSHPQFQLYDLDKFKKYNKRMKILTKKRRDLVREEEAGYRRDLPKFPANAFSRDIPLWNTHTASEMLKQHVTEEMAGTVEKARPYELWKSQKEYQEFPLSTFRKHIYQERSKQLAAPFWQHKRNKIAKKKFDDVELMMKEWEQARLNMSIEAMAVELENICLDNNLYK